MRVSFSSLRRVSALFPAAKSSIFYQFSSTSTKSRISSSMESKETYQDALVALNSLQSNASVIQSWIQARRQDLQVDINKEMLHSIKSLNLDISKLSAIHVAGTKGKGSTCAFTESILRNCGFKTGLYISPHLVSVRERICINGAPLSEEKFAKYFWECYKVLQKSKTEEFPNLPSYFRFLTVMSFKVFLDEKVDVAVIETGVGGRTDATNVLQSPVATGITALGYDHMNVLGNTLAEIAYEKSGIFKPGTPALSVPQPEEAMNVLTTRAQQLSGSPLIVIPPLPSGKYKLGLKGEHNYSNAAMAIALSKIWTMQRQGKKLSDITIGDTDDLPNGFVEGLKKCQWNGRCQLLPVEGHNIKLFLDGAHTGESIEICKDWYLKSSASESSNPLKVLIFNCSSTRNPERLLKPLTQCGFDRVIITTNKSGINHILKDQRPVDMDAQSWQLHLQKSWNEITQNQAERKADVPDALNYLYELEKTNPDREIHTLVTGSLYLVGAWLEVLNPDLRDSFDKNLNN